MFVQVKGGNDTKTSEQWQAEIAGIVEGTLGRFSEQLTSVEVFISDENSREKEGDDDKGCLIEARLAGMQPIAVRTHAPTFEEAVSDCAEKIERTLDRRLGRLEDKDERKSFSGDEPLGTLRGPLPPT
jgi:hypothetical protein